MAKFLILRVNDSFDPENETVYDALDKGADWIATTDGDAFVVLDQAVAAAETMILTARMPTVDVNQRQRILARADQILKQLGERDDQ